MLFRSRLFHLLKLIALLSLAGQAGMVRNKKGEPRPDVEIEDFLVELRAHLESADLIDTVAMLYPKDEPFREFVKHRKPNVYEQYVSGKVYKEIHRDLTRVNAIIKLAFPDKPIGVVLSGHELFHKFLALQENLWVKT